MLSISPALLALLVLFQQWFSPTLGFEIPDSVNLSSWTLPPCFAPCLLETVCLGLRLACKAYQFVLWGPEDFFLVTAYILSVATLPLSAIILWLINLLIVTGADPLDLQLWYALEAATAFVVACVPFIRLMMVRKIIPFIKAKFVLWFLPSQEPSTSQQTVLEPTSPRNRNSDLVLSFSDQNYLHMVESAEPVSSEDHYKHAVHLGTGPISDEPFPHQGLKPSVVAEYATNNKDEKLNIPTTSDPMALRRYGFVINVVDVDARPVMWNTETKSKRSRPLEADRRSL
ncbi:CFEM domain-containing protein [Colletotrichum truncatum]|uniref:CFEM domain-containing protein n=1 Tax=Colletotrichum truncatum TaxID=5467 RepID=A0ACC3YTA5_COLTU